ncbi:hypothetical protein [Actinomadura sp. HBU206391]|uniref:hypothetical protein n=1 Tax=Actinomadura sp. HBU206391 TaxID=2731692 RepID=UPI00164F75BA|nr:hypothetical protein [Actinomadura sp. HBU206391]MBC6458261.1 hypothetical protein [Actinomadura sp. HBU206391]
MLSDEELERRMRHADPTRSTHLADSDGPMATRILAQARRRSQRRRVRLIVAVPLAALAVVSGTAGTYAWVAGDGKGHALDSNTVDCENPARNGAGGIHFDAAQDDPVRACREAWPRFFGAPAPDRLTACVDSSPQGSIKVYPGGRDQCALHRAAPYAGPTDEQRRLARFRVELNDRFAHRGCTSYSETRKLIKALLAEHRLTGWTLRRHMTLSTPRQEGPCAEVSDYSEPERVIWLVDRPPSESANDT